MAKQTIPAPEEESTPKWNPFRRTRAGVALTKAEIKLIRQKRKQLRKDLKKEGVKSKEDFEFTASALGYYFDKQKKGMMLLWFFSGRILPILLAAAISAMAILYGVSQVTQMHGFFTVNITDDLLKTGFSLKEQFSSGYKVAVLSLGDVGVKEIPDSTITWLPEELEKAEGYHGLSKDSGDFSPQNSYFAYSFYITNEGQDTASYSYNLRFTQVTQNIDSALWFILFRSDVDPEGNLSDTKMAFFARQSADGGSEVIPGGTRVAFPDEYPFIHYYQPMLANADQFMPATSGSGIEGYRFSPIPFESETVIFSDQIYNVLPGYAQKYTVVAWLEGEDPDCTDALISGSAGLAMNFSLINSDDRGETA